MCIRDSDKTAEYINIIVDCGGSYDKAARLYDPEEVFTFRYSPSEALGLDPFAFGSSSEEERVDDICETLWLIIKPDAVPSAEERVSLRKIVMMYLHLPLESSWRGFYAWLSNNYAEILDGCQIRPEYFNINQFIHNGSCLLYTSAGDRDLPLVVGTAPCRRAYCVDTDVSVGVYSRFPVR